MITMSDDRVSHDAGSELAQADAFCDLLQAFGGLLQANMAEANTVLRQISESAPDQGDRMAKTSRLGSERIAEHWSVMSAQLQVVADDMAKANSRWAERMRCSADAMAQAGLPNDLWELRRKMLRAEWAQTLVQYSTIAAIIRQTLISEVQALAQAATAASSSGNGALRHKRWATCRLGKPSARPSIRQPTD